MVRPPQDVVASYLLGILCDLLRRRLAHQVTRRSRRQCATCLLFLRGFLLVDCFGWMGECLAFTCQVIGYAGVRRRLEPALGWHTRVRRWPFRKTSLWTGWDPFSRPAPRAVLLNPVPQFVRVDTARSIKFDRREPAPQEFIHFDPAHAKDFGDLSHFEELLHFSWPSRSRRLLWVRFSSHDHVSFRDDRVKRWKLSRLDRYAAFSELVLMDWVFPNWHVLGGPVACSAAHWRADRGLLELHRWYGLWQKWFHRCHADLQSGPYTHRSHKTGAACHSLSGGNLIEVPGITPWEEFCMRCQHAPVDWQHCCWFIPDTAET